MRHKLKRGNAWDAPDHHQSFGLSSLPPHL